jgi:hypothetical protein
MAIAESLLSRLEWTMPHDQIAQAKIMAHEWLAASFK